MEAKFNRLEEEFRIVESKLSAGGLPSQELQELSRRHAELAPIVGRVREVASIEKALADVEAMIKGSDAEMRELAAAEKPELEKKLHDLTEQLKVDLLPKDPRD